jgi:hypothetical protein
MLRVRNRVDNAPSEHVRVPDAMISGRHDDNSIRVSRHDRQ